MSQSDDMIAAIATARANGWSNDDILAFRMTPKALDRLCLEAAQNSTRMLSRAARPKNFMGIKIRETDEVSDWDLVGEQPR